MRPAVALAPFLLLAGTDAVALQSGNVTVYRCVDAKGHVTLADSPCPAGSKEEVRTMQRPQDAPTRPAMPQPVQPPPTAPPPQVVVMRTPQPMYECTTPDGKRYTSETGDGNPRWVPLWTLGYRSGWNRHRTDAGRGGMREADSIWSSVGAPTPRPSPDPVAPAGRPRPPDSAHAQGGGTWIRDTCHALPQAEVCSRLVDRREEIRRRFFNAQETERNALRREERGINARLGADCG